MIRRNPKARQRTLRAFLLSAVVFPAVGCVSVIHTTDPPKWIEFSVDSTPGVVGCSTCHKDGCDACDAHCDVGYPGAEGVVVEPVGVPFLNHWLHENIHHTAEGAGLFSGKCIDSIREKWEIHKAWRQRKREEAHGPPWPKFHPVPTNPAFHPLESEVTEDPTLYGNLRP